MTVLHGKTNLFTLQWFDQLTCLRIVPFAETYWQHLLSPVVVILSGKSRWYGGTVSNYMFRLLIVISVSAAIWTNSPIALFVAKVSTEARSVPTFNVSWQEFIGIEKDNTNFLQVTTIIERQLSKPKLPHTTSALSDSNLKLLTDYIDGLPDNEGKSMVWIGGYLFLLLLL